MPEYEDADHYLGVRGSAYQYRTDDWKRDGQKISFIGRDIESATANGWTLEAGLFEQGDHTLLTFDGSYCTALAEKTAVELLPIVTGLKPSLHLMQEQTLLCRCGIRSRFR